MKDLIKVLENNNIAKVDSRVSIHGNEDQAMIATDAVPYESDCINCRVEGGCDDLNPLCTLTMKHGIRSTGEMIDRHSETAVWTERKALSENTHIPVNQIGLL